MIEQIITPTCGFCGATLPTGKKVYCNRTCYNGARGSSQPMGERFSMRIQWTSTCWLWTGQKVEGYGVFRLYPPHRMLRIKAHRLSWIIHNGPIPEGLCVLHRCDNPPCVNPDHLFLGTDADNMRDRFEKGRYYMNVRGDDHPRSKMTAEKVIEMRLRYANGETIKDLSLAFVMSWVQTRDILKRRAWKHVA